MRTPSIAVLCFALAAAVAAPVTAVCTSAAVLAEARPDALLVVEGGKQVRKPGRVESADHDKVVFTAQGGKKADVAATDVLEIQWGDAPAAYEDGVRALAAGDADAAMRGFQEALREKDVKPDIREWVVEFANAGLGQALVQLGQADKAAEAFGRARASNAKSMILDRILLGLADAELARGKGDAAAKAADDLISAAKAARRTSWELEAHLVKARGKLQGGDFGGASSAYDDAIRFAESAVAQEKTEAGKARLRRAAVEASVRKGWAMVAKAESTKSAGDFDAARSYFDGLVTKHPADPLVLASAANAAGVAKFHAGDAKGALRSFAATEVVQFRARDEVARALWWQAECWKKLGNETFRQDRLKELKQQHPGSEWARRAQ